MTLPLCRSYLAALTADSVYATEHAHYHGMWPLDRKLRNHIPALIARVTADIAYIEAGLLSEERHSVHLAAWLHPIAVMTLDRHDAALSRLAALTAEATAYMEQG